MLEYINKDKYAKKMIELFQKKIPEGTLEIKLIMLKIILQISEGRLISRHI